MRPLGFGLSHFWNFFVVCGIVWSTMETGYVRLESSTDASPARLGSCGGQSLSESSRITQYNAM